LLWASFTCFHNDSYVCPNIITGIKNTINKAIFFIIKDVLESKDNNYY